MARRCVALCLIVMFASSSSAFAQTFERAVARAVAEAAAQDEPKPGSGKIPPGLLWTSVALFAVGGVTLARGAAEDPDTQTCVYSDSIEDTCVSNRTALLSAGAVMAGVGAVLLAVGIKKSHSPQVSFRPGRFSIQQPVPLDLGISRLVRR